MSRYYDRQGRELSMTALDRLLGDRKYKRVEFTELPDQAAEVSTVWLGLDHRYAGDGPPLIFESMVFGGGLDQFCRRYSTEEQARAGHEDVIARVKAEGAAFAALRDDEHVQDVVAFLEARLDGHAHEHWGETGLDNGELYVRLARAVTT